MKIELGVWGDPSARYSSLVTMNGESFQFRESKSKKEG
jgi:hypothetical protein